MPFSACLGYVVFQAVCETTELVITMLNRERNILSRLTFKRMCCSERRIVFSQLFFQYFRIFLLKFRETSRREHLIFFQLCVCVCVCVPVQITLFCKSVPEPKQQGSSPRRWKKNVNFLFDKDLAIYKPNFLCEEKNLLQSEAT